MRVVVTGGAGFVGSATVEYFSRQGHDVIALDNLSRSAMLGDHFLGSRVTRYNWERLAKMPHVVRKEVDVRDSTAVKEALRGAEIIVHTAAQVAVTTSMEDPQTDFEINVNGTFNVLEGARRLASDPVIIYCSTNKVYGSHVNDVAIEALRQRYVFSDPRFSSGIPESLETDHTHHTPYGASKLAADLYMQEYGGSYGLRTGVFRMSCIYGPRQFGMEDQGWVAHFCISALNHRPLVIFGDGKQLRDVLFVEDLVGAYAAYAKASGQLGPRVYNTGGGPQRTMSLLELLTILEKELGYAPDVSFQDWRPADQKVYVSDIRKIEKDLAWSPKVSPEDGVRRILAWARSEGFG
jgi:CDP-paratose 2-epimerase